jgi:hypothetical protein
MAYFLNEDDALKDFYRILKASSVAQEADKEKDEEKQDKLYKRERRLKQKLQKEELSDLFELFDADQMQRMEKPQLQDEDPSALVGGPQQSTPDQGLQHPVIQQRQMVDNMRFKGMGALDAHQSVHGPGDLGDVNSKAKVAATLGRVQKDGTEHGIQYERGGEFRSVMTTDADIEVKLDQVSHNDMRSDFNQQIPDKYQTPQQQQMEELDTQEEIDYTEFDVAYLQQFGRA